MMYDLLFGDRDPVAEPGTATGTRGDWWPAFANVPDILEHAVQGFGIYRSPDRVLDPVLRELGQARAGWAAESQFVFSQHCKSLARSASSEERIAAVGYWPRGDVLHRARAAACSPSPTASCSTAAACPTSSSTRSTIELGDVATLELTYITALYLQHAVMSRALRTEWDDVDERIVEVPSPNATRPSACASSRPDDD